MRRPVITASRGPPCTSTPDNSIGIRDDICIGRIDDAPVRHNHAPKTRRKPNSERPGAWRINSLKEVCGSLIIHPLALRIPGAARPIR